MGGCKDVTRGRQGNDGVSSLLYFAFASDANGTNFSLIPSPTLGFIQFIVLNAPPTSALTLANFPLPFLPFLGANGTNGTNGINGTTVLYSDINTTTCTSSTSDDTLETYTLPANQLAVNGNYIEICGTIKGNSGGSPNICYPHITFGGADVGGMIGIIPQVGLVQSFKVRIFRVSSVRYKYDWIFQTGYITNLAITEFASLAGISTDFTTTQAITLSVRKLGLPQVAGDLNVVNFNIKQYLQ